MLRTESKKISGGKNVPGRNTGQLENKRKLKKPGRLLAQHSESNKIFLLCEANIYYIVFFCPSTESKKKLPSRKKSLPKKKNQQKPQKSHPLGNKRKIKKPGKPEVCYGSS